MEDPAVAATGPGFAGGNTGAALTTTGLGGGEEPVAGDVQVVAVPARLSAWSRFRDDEVQVPDRGGYLLGQRAGGFTHDWPPEC